MLIVSTSHIATTMASVWERLVSRGKVKTLWFPTQTTTTYNDLIMEGNGHTDKEQPCLLFLKTIAKDNAQQVDRAK